ncbi:hypothetical protein PTSG_06010 [Salpingoeca rosetta]|uniref:Uncharacterized protein n=1 Tax=Salpingoeca rosetta (strain ATCC 50818 / BSB-021) TaxID=946362 RepID=F2UDF0_SALR5|nr:uncharacterized protein PTSG_06010 [Salpingoeca rosetta]EGD74645.1 hypothetical protein PTSG_06010 [Salpingoeca rosetta]|eukprot:XP_004992902.1 hypothetical protein PTSG_06010 [Salpingoeca rosetta]
MDQQQDLLPGQQVAMEYICGSCGRRTRIRQMDSLACTNCGHRILYKPRTARPVQVNCR